MWLTVLSGQNAHTNPPMFAVQYTGMSGAEVARALRARAGGYEGGMPPGARISEEAAARRWVAGERAYLRGDFGGQVRFIATTSRRVG